MERKIRVLVTKIGLDGHDRGSKVVAYGLRDAGFEVVYMGLRQTPDGIVNAAVQEDVDVVVGIKKFCNEKNVGLSILSGAHNHLTRRVVEKLKDKGREDIVLLVGGVIPEEDRSLLKEMGVAEVFTSGTGIDQIAQVINEHVKEVK